MDMDAETPDEKEARVEGGELKAQAEAGLG